MTLGDIIQPITRTDSRAWWERQCRAGLFHDVKGQEEASRWGGERIHNPKRQAFGKDREGRLGDLNYVTSILVKF